MPLTSTQKQQRYRERELGPDRDKVRLTTCVSIETRDALDPLAWHLGYTVTRADLRISGADDLKPYYTAHEDDWPAAA
jgi:hypothetical protein